MLRSLWAAPGTAVSSRMSGDRADVEAPHLGCHLPAGERHGDRVAGVEATEVFRGVGAVPLRLGAVRQFLTEEPLTVEQADTAEGEFEIAGGLQVVAGEDAEAAGVLRDELAEPELRGEVGDVGPFATGGGTGKLGQLVAHLGDELVVADESLEIGVVEVGDQGRRVTVEAAAGGELLEQGLGGGGPAPRMVLRQCSQRGAETFGVHSEISLGWTESEIVSVRRDGARRLGCLERSIPRTRAVERFHPARRIPGVGCRRMSSRGPERTFTADDAWSFNGGTHIAAHEVLGAHPGSGGLVTFRVWARTLVR